MFVVVMILFSCLTLGYFISKGYREQLESSIIAYRRLDSLFLFRCEFFFYCVGVRVYCARTQNIDQRLLDRSKKKGLKCISLIVRAVTAEAVAFMLLLLFLKLIFDKAR